MLAGLFAHHFVRGELETAGEAAEELLSIAAVYDGPDSDAMRLVADAAGGVAGFAAGDFRRAATHLDRVVANYDPARHGHMAVAFGQDFGVVGHAYSAFVLGMTGRPDAARTRSAYAVETAERIAHPHSLALALALRGGLHHALRDIAMVRQNATRLRDLSVAQGFSHWEMEAYHLLSWVAATQGRFDQAFDLTARCAASARRLGARLPHAFFQPTIIEILLLAGRADDALQAASELMKVLDERHMRWSLESEVARLYGQSLLALTRYQEAEDAFVKAIALARSRGARLYELRAACDLADLRLRAERANDIRELLLPRFDAFTEGNDIHDVVRARTILDGLAAASLTD
jgi:hypothetical protein